MGKNGFVIVVMKKKFQLFGTINESDLYIEITSNTNIIFLCNIMTDNTTYFYVMRTSCNNVCFLLQITKLLHHVSQFVALIKCKTDIVWERVSEYIITSMTLKVIWIND